MKFAVQNCCTTPVFLPQYNQSIDVVMEELGIQAVKIKEFNCCGYPLKNINLNAHLLASGRNLSLAQSRGLDVVTLCNCCYGSLKHASELINEDKSIGDGINSKLSEEGLSYDGKVAIRHFMEVFYQDIGIEEIKKKISRPFKGLKVAVHYGCHVLRPGNVVQFDSPGTASVFDNLIEITGAELIPWPMQLECCGSPLMGVNDDLSMDLAIKKLSDVERVGADFLVTACSYCQLQFDRIQTMIIEKRGLTYSTPSILYTQLLGLSLGFDAEMLGIEINEINTKGILKFLS